MMAMGLGPLLALMLCSLAVRVAGQVQSINGSYRLSGTPTKFLKLASARTVFNVTGGWQERECQWMDGSGEKLRRTLAFLASPAPALRCADNSSLTLSWMQLNGSGVLGPGPWLVSLIEMSVAKPIMDSKRLYGAMGFSSISVTAIDPCLWCHKSHTKSMD